MLDLFLKITREMVGNIGSIFSWDCYMKYLFHESKNTLGKNWETCFKVFWRKIKVWLILITSIQIVGKSKKELLKDETFKNFEFSLK